jgi:taurine dioxygenase
MNNMASINIRPLQDDLNFGARVTGIDWITIEDQAVRTQLNQLFEERGVIVFEDIEPSSKMQVAISTVFGPLKEHPVKVVPRVDGEALPGVIELKANPETGAIVEVDGQIRTSWQPFHFDHCYNNELNRAGVLRSVVTPPEGGYTAFADGIQLYEALSPELRQAIEDKRVIYTLDLFYANQRFGLPRDFHQLQPMADNGLMEIARSLPRAIHPAVWSRRSGEKVLHVSGYMSVGLEGHEDPEGDALLQAVCMEIRDKAKPYVHKWKPTDMVIWDNWRVLHEAYGVDPKYQRCIHRTTISGDYGLGYWESRTPDAGAVPMEMM